ncbi:MAG TPA: tripartite tricarboxylate transporter permease [Vicinamibacteria bacterium]|nr:tripartite tricarboxylate transporter permease [Vicinamibacteria bacterium]
MSAFGFLAGGVLLGIVVGAIPGLTATLAISLLLPFTFSLPPAEALLALTGIYVGGIFGGAITAITLRIPGAPANTMTLLDGHEMARAGRAEGALGLAIFSSTVGGLFGGVVLVLLAPQLARLALRFQSPEMFSMVVLALVAVASVSVGPLSKGLAATVLGLMLSTLGLDKLVPAPRFTFDVPDLLVGVPLLPVVIGLFALSEMFRQSGEPEMGGAGRVHLSFRGMLAFVPMLETVGFRLFAKSAAIGAFVGALPGGGAAMAAFLAYSEAKRGSDHPEKFGTGIPEGVAAPETANNAMTGGAFVPMLAFGIPGDSVTAVILGGLLIQGMTPGPMMFRENQELMTTLFVGFFAAYLILFVLGMGLLPLFARIGALRRCHLYPFIAVVALVAAYASERTMFAMGLAVVVGVLGYGLTRFGYPLVPVLLGFLLGPPLETNFRRALIVSDNGWWVFVTSPISALLLTSSCLLAFWLGRGHERRFPTDPSSPPSST